MKNWIKFWKSKDRKPVDLQIVSGATSLRLPGIVNHRAYADRHRIPYFFDMMPSDIDNPYMHKLVTLQRALPRTEWTFWLDDDAFFMQFEHDIRTLLNKTAIHKDISLIFCRSPINDGKWTTISAGNFFIRNNKIGKEFLDLTVSFDPKIVKEWWDEDLHGLSVGNDQDTMVYLIKNFTQFSSATLLLDFHEFNSRPFHFTHPHEHFLVHFAGGQGTKLEQVKRFSEKHGLDEFLLRPEQSEPYKLYFDEIRRTIKAFE